FMIHGGGDTYIKPEMAQALFARAKPPKEIWVVEGAKHNQAIQIAGDEYHRRVCAFFERHLAREAGSDADGAAGSADAAARARRSLVRAGAFALSILFSRAGRLSGGNSR